MKNKKNIIGSALILAAFLGTAYAAEGPAWDEANLESGKYEIAVGKKAIESKDAEDRLISFLSAMKKKKTIESEIDSIVSDESGKFDLGSAPPSLIQSVDIIDFNRYMAMCHSTIDTNSNLTSILALASIPINEKWSNKPIIDALERVEKDFPRTWQAKFVPLLIAQSNGRAKEGKTKEGLLRILKNLKRSVKDEVRMDEKDPQLRAFIAFSKIETPLGAEILFRLANSEMELGISGKDGVMIKQAKEDYQALIKKFPTSRQAKESMSSIEELNAFEKQ